MYYIMKPVYTGFLVKGPQCATKCGTFDMCATSATNVAQNVAQFYLYFKYKCPPATRSRLLGWDPWMDIIENIAN